MTGHLPPLVLGPWRPGLERLGDVVSRPCSFLGAAVSHSLLHELSDSSCVTPPLLFSLVASRKDGRPTLVEVGGVYVCIALQDPWQFMAELASAYFPRVPESLSG